MTTTIKKDTDGGIWITNTLPDGMVQEFVIGPMRDSDELAVSVFEQRGPDRLKHVGIWLTRDEQMALFEFLKSHLEEK
jgi:hypothetical protein